MGPAAIQVLKQSSRIAGSSRYTGTTSEVVAKCRGHTWAGRCDSVRRTSQTDQLISPNRPSGSQPQGLANTCSTLAPNPKWSTRH